MQLNAAESSRFLGEPVLSVKPLSRESGDMLDTRWMVILDNRICIFGTSWLVQNSLRRYAEHAVPDSVLEERLSLLRRDVTSWNLLAGSAKSQKNISFAQPRGAWAQLQEDADVLMVAARFGTRIRVDFSIHADAGHDREFFARKAAFFADALAGGRNPQPAIREKAQPGLENFSVESNRVEGSVHMSRNEFASWCEHIY